MDILLLNVRVENVLKQPMQFYNLPSESPRQWCDDPQAVSFHRFDWHMFRSFFISGRK
jgi:hypothetical protein